MLTKVKEKISLILTVALGLGIWFSPAPAELSLEGWHLFAIFIAMIFGVIVKAMPMGAITIIGVALVVVTNTLSLPNALSGFSDKVIWLIVMSFFIARGFIKTGLGSRIAYRFIKIFGKSTLGIAYSAIFSEFVLSPATPSVTARCAGIIYPIVNSISRVLGSKPNTESAGDVGTFLTLTTIHGSVICSAMFITAIAGNPIIVKIINEVTGIQISWFGWMQAAIVPGLISLIMVPLVIYWICPPKIKRVPGAREFAQEKLDEMGPMSIHEWVLSGVFMVLITLWIAEKYVGVHSVTTAFIGVSLLLVTGVLTWSDIIEEKGAWGTFVWFSILLALASFLSELGVMSYFSNIIATQVKDYSWPVGFIIMALVYYYSHYLFASGIAHVTAMFGGFLSVAILVGAPPMLAALTMAFFSSLFGTLTHYGIGPGPALFSSGYTTLKQWWKVGAVVSLLHIGIWMGLGSAWWKFLGLW